MILDEGLNRARDLVDADIVDGIAGTSATAVAATDTGLGGAVGATEADVTTETSDKTITITYDINSATGNGNTLYEWLIRMNSESDAFVRSLTAGVIKTANMEVQRKTLIYFDRG